MHTTCQLHPTITSLHERYPTITFLQLSQASQPGCLFIPESYLPSCLATAELADDRHRSTACPSPLPCGARNLPHSTSILTPSSPPSHNKSPLLPVPPRLSSPLPHPLHPHEFSPPTLSSHSPVPPRLSVPAVPLRPVTPPFFPPSLPAYPHIPSPSPLPPIPCCPRG